jgi:pyridoxine/pyridoxamine 5'-phosphate oxidase
MVLLRGWDEKGFVFFTNYESRKSRDMMENKNVALNFWWGQLSKQVKFESIFLIVK